VSVRAEGAGLRFTLGTDILFDFNKFDLRAEVDPILRKLVEQVRAEVPSRARCMVEGHTDAKGTDVYNLGLSNRRAKLVRDWFVKHGAVTSRDITTVGLGEGSPVAPNERPDGSDDPEGRQRNRRVEIVVTPLP
jgi:outer membrane protein OmpA-like peptidoglycan-associated protein